MSVCLNFVMSEPSEIFLMLKVFQTTVIQLTHTYSIALHDMSSITIINYNNCDKNFSIKY